MKSLSSSTSICRRCQYYAPEGRRGGHCQQLNVAVQGAWTACALAVPPFSPAWENLEDIMVWQQKNLAAMQASAESAMTEALSEAPRVGATSLSESVTMQYGESAEPACNSVVSNHTEQAHTTQPYVAQLLPVTHVQTLGIKALWM